MKHATAVIVTLMIAISSSPAHARSVFLNGVDISDLRNKTFKNAEVTIDGEGNIKIVAPRYEVKVAGSAAPPAAPHRDERGGPNPSLLKRYYLVTQPPSGGQGCCAFELKVNGETRKVIRAGAPQVIIEISKWLRKGENEVILLAKKPAGNAPTASSADTTLLVGIGHEENKIVKIDLVKARLTANATLKETVRKPIVLVAE